MSQSKRDSDAPKVKENPFDREGFLYSVLNLPTTASAEEVRERYKSLSVLFHPDKQREESTKDTASKRFLEIQKAYEVLSDPFLRTVYDIYGFEGTRMKWPPELRSKPRDELVKLLNRSNWELEAQRMEDLVRSHGRLVIGVNASSLFSNMEHVDSAPSFRGWYGRLQGIRISSFALRHIFQREIDDKTRLVLTTRAPSGKSRTGSILGTVKHQYSPRLSFEAAATLLPAHFVMVKTRYHNEAGTFVLQTYLSPSLEPAFPPITVTHSRRLFKDSLTQGVLICHMGNEPHFSVNIVSPHRFGGNSDPLYFDREEPQSKLGSWSGFGTGLRQWSCGINLAGLGTSLRAEWSLALPELMAEASLAVQLSLGGPGWVVTGSWGDEHAGITTTVGFDAAGVELTLNLSYLGQRLVLPVVLAENGNAPLACLLTTLPSTAFLLAYQLILKPRRRKQRAEFYRQARKELLEEKSNIRREIEETILLLRETARRHTQAEKIKEGLVVLEALYGPTDPDPEARALLVDVTVPIQALVHRSQLYIPGHCSKSGLQGFYDPVPSCAKSLHIRYTFGGRVHYCEIPDYKPVVLPLGDHLVERVA